MKIKTSTVLLSAALLLSGFNTSFASQTQTVKSSFGKEQKDLIINKLAHAISTQYVLEDKGIKFSQQLLAKNSSGAYGESATKEDFIQQLNKSLYQITNDKHVSVRPAASEKNGKGPQKRMMRKMVKSQPQENADKSQPQRKMVRMDPGASAGKSLKAQFGLPEGPSMATDILPGNIGLLTISDLMGEVSELDESMAKLANTDGLIIDVRECPGGSGEISTQLSSYFMPEGEELMSHYTRGEPARVSTSVVLPDGASRYFNKPVYLVTSGFTGSACEALTFVTKYHDLATIVGENTAGAGHALTSDLTPMGFGLAAFIPNSMPSHPKHKGGFEKIGVPVDVNASAPIAVDRALQLILSELLAKNSNSPTLAKALISSTEKTNKVLLEQVQNRRKYHALLGDYGDGRALIFEQGQLKYKTPRGMKIPLKQLDSDLFMMMSKRASSKVRVERNTEGEVTGISLSPRPGQTQWKALQRG